METFQSFSARSSLDWPTSNLWMSKSRLRVQSQRISTLMTKVPFLPPLQSHSRSDWGNSASCSWQMRLICKMISTLVNTYHLSSDEVMMTQPTPLISSMRSACNRKKMKSYFSKSTSKILASYRQAPGKTCSLLKSKVKNSSVKRMALKVSRKVNRWSSGFQNWSRASLLRKQ